MSEKALDFLFAFTLFVCLKLISMRILQVEF